VRGCPVQTQITLSLCGKVSGAGHAGKGKGFWRERACVALRAGSGTVGEHMDTHLPQAVESVEKRFIFRAVFIQQTDGLGCVCELTSIPQGDYGQVTIEGFHDLFVSENS
jgi:hypothetical protein